MAATVRPGETPTRTTLVPYSLTMRPRLLGLFLVLFVSVLLAVPPTAADQARASGASLAADQVDIDIPTIDWGRCEYYEPPVECAVVRLPLDYDDTDGPTTPVKVLRSHATGERTGSLFVNPGGPGGSSLDFARYAARLIGPGVARRFDVIGVEPRGVGENPPATCRVTRETPVDYPRVGYPITTRQVTRQIRADRQLNRACRQGRSPITDHLSTADHARDIDVVRQAVGDEALTFYGISYGSVVGQTYAAMFPDRVRAIIVDGVLDPISWTTGRRSDLPSTYRIGSGKGAYEALVSALNECDRVGRHHCSIAGHANESWLRALRLARRGELRFGGGRVTVQDIVGQALGTLYSARSIKYLIRFLREVDRRTTTASGGSRVESAWDDLQRLRERRDEIGPYGVGRAAPVAEALPAYGRAYVAFQAVLCSDSVNPDNPRRWERTSRIADRTQPWFGRLWTWASSLCAGWPGKGGNDSFRGPWRTTTSTPLLIVGNTHDPATPIRGARAANRLFDDSVLLTLDGWGHGALGSSDCVRQKMAAYLIEQRLPRPSSWCKPDRQLFP